MKFAIISAGEGSRLVQEGVALPKPLVPLNGVAMIERLIHLFIRNGAASVVVIINNESELTKEFLATLQTEVPLEMIVKTTPSSMHSFYELSSYLKDDKFCLTTVDTVFQEGEFSNFIEAFKQSEIDGYMAVTDFVDDEKPLYISTDPFLYITGFYDQCMPAATSSVSVIDTHTKHDFMENPLKECNYISGGVYCLTPASLKVLEKCMVNGMSRMRNFQRQLIAEGMKLKAYPFSKIIDVDHVEDIEKAEKFLSGEK